MKMKTRKEWNEKAVFRNIRWIYVFRNARVDFSETVAGRKEGRGKRENQENRE